MDRIRNPYSPGAGAPPPYLVGRDPILEQADVLLGRIKVGRPEKSLLLIGLRGVGKTVLLNKIEGSAKDAGFQTIFIEAHENKSLGNLLVPELRTLLFSIDRMAGAGNKAKRALGVLRSFMGALKLTYGDVSLSLDIDPEEGSADSGDIEIDLPQLFVAIGEAAVDRGCAIAILVDELQYLSKKEFGALIMAMHKLQQKQLPMVLLGAGLPGLAGESKSYAERLFNYPEVGALSKEDAFKGLAEPASVEGVEFKEPALDAIYELTQGYPYFVQEWGYKVWNLADSSPIPLKAVEKATPEVIHLLDENFFKVRFDRLTPTEKNFLRMMAELGEGPYKVGDIASKFGYKVSSLSPTRANLMKKGMVYSPSYGCIAFTVPLFDQFMKRAIPEIPENSI